MTASGSFVFLCPACKYKARIPENYRGATIKCPGCGGAQKAIEAPPMPSTGKTVQIMKVASTPMPFTLPADQAAALAAAGSATGIPAVEPVLGDPSAIRPVARPADPSPARGNPVLSGQPIEFQCSSCQARMKIPAHYLGKSILCPKCSAPQKVVPAEQLPQPMPTTTSVVPKEPPAPIPPPPPPVPETPPAPAAIDLAPPAAQDEAPTDQVPPPAPKPAAKGGVVKRRSASLPAEPPAEVPAPAAPVSEPATEPPKPATPPKRRSAAPAPAATTERSEPAPAERSPAAPARSSPLPLLASVGLALLLAAGLAFLYLENGKLNRALEQVRNDLQAAKAQADSLAEARKEADQAKRDKEQMERLQEEVNTRAQELEDLVKTLKTQLEQATAGVPAAGGDGSATAATP